MSLAFPLTSTRSPLLRRHSRPAKHSRCQGRAPGGVTPSKFAFLALKGTGFELPEERLTAEFNQDSVLVPHAGPGRAIRHADAGIIGEGVDLSLEHLGDMRPSTLLFHVTQRLLYTKWRDPARSPSSPVGQLKRITKQWLDTCLVCKGGTYPALLMYQELADMACNRITAGITRAFLGGVPLRRCLTLQSDGSSTTHVRFNTSKSDRWETART